MQKTTNCQRCNGTGYVSPRLSRGCAGDVCFRCNGQGIVKVSKSRKVTQKPLPATATCWIACHPNPAFCASEAYASKEDAMHAASMRTGWIVKEGEYNAKSIRPTGWFGKVA